MKRTNRFLIGAAIAALTFGSLVAIQGPKEWNYHHRHYGWHHHHDCHHHDQDGAQKPSEDEDKI